MNDDFDPFASMEDDGPLGPIETVDDRLDRAGGRTERVAPKVNGSGAPASPFGEGFSKNTPRRTVRRVQAAMLHPASQGEIRGWRFLATPAGAGRLQLGQQGRPGDLAPTWKRPSPATSHRPLCQVHGCENDNGQIFRQVMAHTSAIA